MIYRFRIVLDAEEDIFRDLELESSSTFEDLHNAIIQSFGLSGHEMATFYVTDEEWNQGEAIALTDMFEEPSRLMEQTTLNDIFTAEQKTALYIYDFLNMWTFLVELADIAEPEPNRSYPNLMFSHGNLPDEAPEKEFVAEGKETDDEQYDDDLDPEDYGDLDFNENWN